MTDDTRRIWFDNDGSLHSGGPVPLAVYLDELSKRLGLFRAKLESCARDASGAYVFRDARAGRPRGIEVVWARIWMLAAAASSSLLPELRLGQDRARRRAARAGAAASAPAAGRVRAPVTRGTPGRLHG